MVQIAAGSTVGQSEPSILGQVRCCRLAEPLEKAKMVASLYVKCISLVNWQQRCNHHLRGSVGGFEPFIGCTEPGWNTMVLGMPKGMLDCLLGSSWFMLFEYWHGLRCFGEEEMTVNVNVSLDKVQF